MAGELGMYVGRQRLGRVETVTVGEKNTQVKIASESSGERVMHDGGVSSGSPAGIIDYVPQKAAKIHSHSKHTW